jgi:hypothetical protein
MTEAEWLACNSPVQMLEFLWDKVSDRKLRLWACACCRGVWERLSDKRLRVAVETCERVADGLEPLGALAAAELLASEALDEIQSGAGERRWYYVEQDAALLVGRSCSDELYTDRLIDILAFATGCAVFADSGDEAAARRREYHAQASWLHDIFGNPFRHERLDSAWLAWNGGTVPKLAQAIYDERAYDRLPILADALEEAGCTNLDIQTHFRGPGPHVRGCWALDLILGKQ